MLKKKKVTLPNIPKPAKENQNKTKQNLSYLESRMVVTRGWWAGEKVEIMTKGHKLSVLL